MTAREINEQGLALLRYGDLITDVINFLIVAFVAFLVARWATKYFKALEAAPPPPLTKSEELLEEIRDLLRERNTRPIQ